jgi:archaellum component FlaC
MIDFTKIPNIHYWTQRVLPCVFDESLSYVEKINKLEEEFNNLINDYNKFGQNVVTEINTFEEETTNQINSFIQQVTDEINQFKADITSQLNTFKTDITNQQNNFESSITNQQNTFETTIRNLQKTFEDNITNRQTEFENNITTIVNNFKSSVNASIANMQSVVDDIPNTVSSSVNDIAVPWLQTNVPNMVSEQVANDVNKIFDVDSLIYVTHDTSIEDLNNWTTTGIYYGTSLSILSNYPTNIESGDMYWCFVGHTDSGSSEVTMQQSLYLNNGSCFTRSYVNTSNAWDSWVRVSNTFRNIDSNSTVDFNTFFTTDTNYGLNDTWIGVYNSTKWSNVPSNLVDGDVVKVNIYHYIITSNRFTVQVISKIYSTSNQFINIGKTWSRNGVGTTFSSWNPTTLDYQYQEILTNTQLNDLTETGIYTISSESGVTIGGLPSKALQYGSFYIRVTANNIGTNSDEIIQEIINAGSGASSYTREKQGAQWSNWKKIGAELVYSTNKTFTIGNGTPYWWDNIVTTLKYNFSDMPNYECQIDVWNSMLSGYLQIPLVVGCTMTNYAGTNAVNLTPTVYCPLADEIVSDQTFTMNIKVFKRY